MPSDPPTAAAPAWRGWSIRRRLLMLVLFVTVPMLAGSVAVVQKLAQSERMARREAIIYTARSLQSAVDSQLGKLIAIGRTLSVSPTLESGNLAGFRKIAEQAIQDLKGVWVLVADPAGQQTLNLAVPPGEPLPRRNPEAIATQTRAFETHRPEISNVFLGAYNKGPIITIEVPVFRDGAPAYVVSVVVDVAHFLDLMNREHAPEGWLLGIIDRRGNFIARSFEPERWVGKPASAGWRAAMHRDGVFEFASLEGDPIVQAITVSPVSGWSVGVAANKDALDRPVWQSTVDAALVGGAITLISLLFAALIASTITRPIEALAKGAGQTATGLPEIDRAIRARRVAESKLYDSEERLRLAVTSAALGIYVWYPKTGQLDWDDRSRELWGLDPGEASTYETFFSGLHPDDREATQAAVDRALDPKGDGKYLADYRVLPRGGGPERWVRATGLVYFEGGQPVRMIGTVLDITERKRAEQRQALLTQELAHRGKNLLAVIQSIVSQILSRAQSPQEAKEAVLGRMQSLSRTYNTLTSSAWEGAELTRLVRDELGAFVAQTELKGPPLKVHPKAAQTLALAIHELATNAAKYGALSVPRGSVAVTWWVDGYPDAPTFNFRWEERDGPPVQPPTHRGFGASITDQVIAFEFGAKPVHEYAPEGVRYAFATALSKLVSPAFAPGKGTKEEVRR